MRTCFNGAAVFQPRKVINRFQVVLQCNKLQWGRGLSTAERKPRSRGRKKHQGFNGAAVFQPRKVHRSSRTRHERRELQWGRGLSTATQHPKDLETKIVGNCATHLYGLNNSPASLATLQDLMSQKGGDGNDIARLKTGQFYIHNADAGHQHPIKIKVPLSLSLSPSNPLEEAQILTKAQLSQVKLLDKA